MRKLYLKNLLGIAAAIFGGITIFASSSVLFGYSDVFQKEGSYPVFILWVNLITGPLYLLAAAGFFYKKMMTLPVLKGILLLLFVNLAFLLMLIITGGDYEMDTWGAMTVRIAVTGIFTFFARKTRTKIAKGTP